MGRRCSAEKREQAPRSPNASRQGKPESSRTREAFGVRPACRRFWPSARLRRSFWLVLPGLQLPIASALADSATNQGGFPRPLDSYAAMPGASLWQILMERVQAEPFNLVATIIFFLAILHTFLAPKFMRLAHRFEREHQERLGTEAKGPGLASPRAEVSFLAEVFHFLGEIEAIFGIWVVPLLIAMTINQGWHTARDYIGHRLDFTEPMFVVIIMTMAASQPILKFSESGLSLIARLGRSSVAAWWFTIVTVGPLLGSLITEPACAGARTVVVQRHPGRAEAVLAPAKPETRLRYVGASIR